MKMNRTLGSIITAFLLLFGAFFTPVSLTETKMDRKSGWSPLGSGVSGGFISGMESLDGSIESLTVAPDGTLYASGEFSEAGGVKANHIAKWNGSAWSSLGSGLNGAASALALGPDGSLYAGGYFKIAGGATVTSEPDWRGTVAKWNGSNWAVLPKVDLGQIFALVVARDGTLYAAGEANQSPKVKNNCIWKLNGTTWFPVGSGMMHIKPGYIPQVRALAVAPDGSVYAGGNFTKAGDVNANGIAKWSGFSWSALGSGIDNKGDIMALSFAPDGTLYAGGRFTTVEGVIANGTAKWNGSSWSALGSGLCGNVYAISSASDGSVYAGGVCSQKNNIAKWNGRTWSALGSGVDNNVAALAVDPDGVVYVGGWFQKAGGKKANYIAKWN